MLILEFLQYGHQMVIANVLSHRKSEVIFVFPDEKPPEFIRLTENDPETEIEEKIVKRLVELHNHFIEAYKK